MVYIWGCFPPQTQPVERQLAMQIGPGGLSPIDHGSAVGHPPSVHQTPAEKAMAGGEHWAAAGW